MANKILTIGIPAYKAQNTIRKLLGSVLMQTEVDKVCIIIANDFPADNGLYEELKNQYPDLDITILNCESNTGPGLARQRCLDACKTDWITFVDADDMFINPVAIENLLANITPNCIEVQGPFYQECLEGKLNTQQKQEMLQNIGQFPPRMISRNDVTHPWVFGRMYNVKFLKENKINFSALRAMEDGEFNWKIRMLIEGSPLKINLIEDPIYLWRTGSEHSITRIGIEENDGVPLYNYDLCQVGATAAAINAIKFCKKKNPFNGSITRFAVEQMISHYFTYIETLNKKEMFAEQTLFNAKRFYHSVYKYIETDIDIDIIKQMYTQQMAAKAQDFIGIIPQITFFEFMAKIKTENYKGKEDFDVIRSKLPEWVIELDKKSGVLGAEGYVYTDDEK